jgi:hypothetical protein
MRIDRKLLRRAAETAEVLPGNLYPAHGGRRKPSTEYWLVVATSDTGAHCIGYDGEGNPVSTSSYGKHALRERPVIGRVDVASLTLTDTAP